MDDELLEALEIYFAKATGGSMLNRFDHEEALGMRGSERC
jgi:hypothetical protein